MIYNFISKNKKMSLRLKTLSFWNVDKMNWYSNNNHNVIKEIKYSIDSVLPMKDSLQSTDLVVTCINGLYSHRVGVLGYLFKYTSIYYPSDFRSVYLRNFINTYCYTDFIADDTELISGAISVLNRFIPIFNYPSWDDKLTLINTQKEFSTLTYLNIPNSLPSMFNFNYYPLFDSGTGIFANKPATYYGFIPFQHSNLFQYSTINIPGITYNLYTDETKNILIVTFNLTNHSDSSILFKTQQDEIIQVLTLTKNLEKTFNNTLNKNLLYETIIIGEFRYIDMTKNIPIEDIEPSLLYNYKITPLDCLLNTFMLRRSNEPDSTLSIPCIISDKELYSNVYNTFHQVSFLDNDLTLDNIHLHHHSPTNENPASNNENITELKYTTINPLNKYIDNTKDTDNETCINTNIGINLSTIQQNYFKDNSSSKSSISSLNSDEWSKVQHGIV